MHLKATLLFKQCRPKLNKRCFRRVGAAKFFRANAPKTRLFVSSCLGKSPPCFFSHACRPGGLHGWIKFKKLDPDSPSSEKSPNISFSNTAYTVSQKKLSKMKGWWGKKVDSSCSYAQSRWPRELYRWIRLEKLDSGNPLAQKSPTRIFSEGGWSSPNLLISPQHCQVKNCHGANTMKVIFLDTTFKTGQ